MSSAISWNPSLDGQRRRLLSLLRELSFEEREVTLASGQKSNFYIDCRQTSLHAEGHFLIGQLLRAAIEQLAPTAEAVGGVTLGADPLASATSLMSFLAGRPLPAFLIRKETKGHGTGQWIEGMKNLRQDMPVVIVEDVITTGGSALKAVERAEAAGLRVLHVLALVDRLEGGRDAITRRCPATALFSRRDFLP
jgi:orotate phosphoribosyltransferase